MDTKQMRFCVSIACKKLVKRECTAKECEHPDKEAAIGKRMQEVKHGGNS